MEDKDIIALYFSRNERAIEETHQKYGGYCLSIAHNLLPSREDAEECVSDAYIGAWNSIPPHQPRVLSAFLGRIVRCACLKKWRSLHTAGRGGGEPVLVFDELSECIPHSDSIENCIEAKELSVMLDDFLLALPPTERQVFVCRYWYFDSINAICARFGFGESRVKSMLCRTRRKLRTMLEQEGYFS